MIVTNRNEINIPVKLSQFGVPDVYTFVVKATVQPTGKAVRTAKEHEVHVDISVVDAVSKGVLKIVSAETNAFGEVSISIGKADVTYPSTGYITATHIASGAKTRQTWNINEKGTLHVDEAITVLSDGLMTNTFS